MIFSAVLCRSLAFGPEHVEWLGRQVAKHYPDATFTPFSDTPLNIPHERLVNGFPTWWSKMEALRRLTSDTVVMLDLDTVLLKPIDIPVPPPGFAYMQSSPRDFDKIWGGLQFSSPEFRKVVSDRFYENPARIMEDSLGCDQKFYRALFRDRIKLLNVERPDAMVSYKLHYLQQGFLPENAFVGFHGLPRPWHVVEPWIPPLFPSE
jgi:hypothetical protein